MLEVLRSWFLQACAFFSTFLEAPPILPHSPQAIATITPFLGRRRSPRNVNGNMAHIVSTMNTRLPSCLEKARSQSGPICSVRSPAAAAVVSLQQQLKNNKLLFKPVFVISLSRILLIRVLHADTQLLQREGSIVCFCQDSTQISSRHRLIASPPD